MVVFLETSISCDVSGRNCHNYGYYLCTHVCYTLDMVPFQLVTYQLWTPPYAQGERESVSTSPYMVEIFFFKITFNLMKQILLLLENLILRRTFHIGPSKSMWNNMRWQICNYVLRKQRWWKVACLRMLVTTTGLVMTIVERRNPQHFKIAVVCEVD